MKQVLVFKTSVNSSQDMRAVEPLLNDLLDKTERWNFDLEDCDRVLRIEAEFIDADIVIESFQKLGVECAELE